MKEFNNIIEDGIKTLINKITFINKLRPKQQHDDDDDDDVQVLTDFIRGAKE